MEDLWIAVKAIGYGLWHAVNETAKSRCGDIVDISSAAFSEPSLPTPVSGIAKAPMVKVGQEKSCSTKADPKPQVSSPKAPAKATAPKVQRTLEVLEVTANKAGKPVLVVGVGEAVSGKVNVSHPEMALAVKHNPSRYVGQKAVVSGCVRESTGRLYATKLEKFCWNDED